MSYDVQAIIEPPEEIKAARKWFTDYFNPNQPAGSFAEKDGKQTGLIYIPPVSQETLSAILVFIGAAISQDKE